MELLSQTELPGGLPPAEPAPNPFDPARLRLSQNFAAAVGVKKVLTTIPCRKPNRHEFVRVRTGEDWRLETAVFEDKANRETYLVDPGVVPDLSAELYPACLFLTITRQNDVLLWPVRLPGVDGKTNSWNDSALAAARLAQSRWVRVAANMAAGMYDVFEAQGDLAEPTWPDLSFPEVLRLTFKDRFITSLDHPACRALRGEA